MRQNFGYTIIETQVFNELIEAHEDQAWKNAQGFAAEVIVSYYGGYFARSTDQQAQIDEDALKLSLKFELEMPYAQRAEISYLSSLHRVADDTLAKNGDRVFVIVPEVRRAAMILSKAVVCSEQEFKKLTQTNLQQE